ncbi:MAG TPA: ISL3 family transposase [Candidatus Dormibacteraeota bacterium]|nr:ISL3 family transposase [Candidatus Dormibacteraeota bacterium]
MGLPQYEISNIERNGGTITISARYTGPISCPSCGGSRLRNKGGCRRTVRHDDWGFRQCVLELNLRKSRCLDCGRSFRQQIPGIQPFQRASESFQEMVFQQHLDGMNRSCLGRRKGIGAATVQRYFFRRLKRRARQDHAQVCPKVLGIDEHFFTRKKGYATTFCDLRNHRIYDVALGRSEASLESYFLSLEGKQQVRIVCMDLAVVYRSIVRKHFPKAVIVADRFHVIRLVNHHFLACWREIDPVGSKNRGLISLMRRHRHNLKPEQKLRLLAYLAERPALKLIYRFKQKLCYLLLKKHKTRQQCQKLIPRFLRAVLELRQSGLAQLITLGDTLNSWSEEIARMWRFTRSNGITEGFHNKMETITRQAYGFRNFENYRQRVQVLCS